MFNIEVQKASGMWGSACPTRVSQALLILQEAEASSLLYCWGFQSPSLETLEAPMHIGHAIDALKLSCLNSRAFFGWFHCQKFFMNLEANIVYT